VPPHQLGERGLVAVVREAPQQLVVRGRLDPLPQLRDRPIQRRRDHDRPPWDVRTPVLSPLDGRAAQEFGKKE